jgi:hypothetical protein
MASEIQCSPSVTLPKGSPVVLAAPLSGSTPTLGSIGRVLGASVAGAQALQFGRLVPPPNARDTT